MSPSLGERALFLIHPATDDCSLMKTTPGIAMKAYWEEQQITDLIEWSFAPHQQRQLRHLPDICVRPGGIRWEDIFMGSEPYEGIPISPEDRAVTVPGLELSLSPLLDEVPIGAPVRLSYYLDNRSPQPVPVPSSIGFKAGVVSGRVIDPTGTARRFSTMLRADGPGLVMLEPDGSVGHSLTLLRGRDGALFPYPGMHHVIVTLQWFVSGMLFSFSAETRVMVGPAVTEGHVRAAGTVLSTPDALLTLVIGGDHLVEGVEAIRTALAEPVLRPHYAYTEARRLMMPAGARKADIEQAASLIDDATVMSPAELARASAWIKARRGKAAQQLQKILRSKEKSIK